MVKHITCLAVVVAGLAGCPATPPDSGSCTSNADCNSNEVCTSSACVVVDAAEGEGDGVVAGEGEGDVVAGEGEGDVVAGEGEGDVVAGEGEGEPLDLTPRITSQEVILGVPSSSGNTFNADGHIAVIDGVTMRGSNFRVTATH